MPKIREIFSQAFGLNSDDQLNSLARILYHYEFDGIKRRSAPNDSNLKEILDKEISEKVLNDLLQEHIFKRIRGTKERQQIDTSNHFSDETKQQFSDETKQQLMQDFEKIGFVAEVSPKPGKKYESVIIFGAAQKGMENRLNDFLEHFLPKINENRKEIFFLVGERDAWLDSESCAKEILLERINRSPKINGINEKTLEDLNKEIQFISKYEVNVSEQRKLQVKHFTNTYGIKFPTETDIARKIVEKIKKENKALEGVKIAFINAEKKPNGSRPDTTDTLRAFIKIVESRKGGFNFKAVMAISNQPYVFAQALALMADERLCGIDVVGKEGSRQVDQLNILASELAGGLYRYLALSKEQQQDINSDQPRSSQGNPPQETGKRRNNFIEFVTKVGPKNLQQ